MTVPAAASPEVVESAPVVAQGWWDQPLVEMGGVALTPAGLVGAVCVFVAAWVVSWLVQRGLNRFSQREGAPDRRAAIYTVGRIVHYLLLVIALLVALELIGLPASRFAVFAGAIGVGLGFGLQAIFNNFISGLILLFDRSLKVGDFVELESGVHGEVSDINIR
ncbi:MAG TPA: mechanosensitive ion channel domain-containing protein, partial [Arenimonas sp.]|nr:mechanosensitive ion channel domain-containing protein [Arenimonas sp.]